MTNQEGANNWFLTNKCDWYIFGTWYCRGTSQWEGPRPFSRTRVPWEDRSWVWESHIGFTTLFSGIPLIASSQNRRPTSVLENMSYGGVPFADRYKHVCHQARTAMERRLPEPARGASAMAPDEDESKWGEKGGAFLSLRITPSSRNTSYRIGCNGPSTFLPKPRLFLWDCHGSQMVWFKTKWASPRHWWLAGVQGRGTKQRLCYRWVKMQRSRQQKTPWISY